MEESYFLTIMPFLRKHFCGPFGKLGGDFPEAKIIVGPCIRQMCLEWIRVIIGGCKRLFSDLFTQWQENMTDFYLTWVRLKKLVDELIFQQVQCRLITGRVGIIEKVPQKSEMSEFVDKKTQAMLPLEQPAEGAPAKTKTVAIEGVAEDAKLDEEKLTDAESKKVIVKQSPGEKEINVTVVKGPKLNEEMLRNEEMKKCDVKEFSEEKEIETRKTSGEENVKDETFKEEDIETEKDSEKEKFEYSKNIYKKKEASLKDDTKLATPNEALQAPAAENAQNELAHVLAPLEAQAEDTDSEPRFPKRNR